MEIKISFEEKLIKKEISLFLKNNGDRTYFSYVRFLLDGDSGVSNPVVISNDKRSDGEFEITGQKGHKEAGLYIKLDVGQTQIINFHTELGVNKNEDLNNYNLVVRSQPGMTEMPVKIAIAGVDVTKINSQPHLSLTDEGMLLYNTKLLRDLDLKLIQSN